MALFRMKPRIRSKIINLLKPLNAIVLGLCVFMLIAY